MSPRPAPHSDELAMAAALRPHTRRVADLVEARIADARAHAAHGNHQAAAKRLDELSEALAGDSGLISAARVAFLQLASAATGFSAADRDLETVARTARIGGRDAPGARTARAIGDAKRTLRLETNAGAMTHESLSTWSSRHGRAIESTAKGELSDGQMGLHNAIYAIATGGMPTDE